MQTGQLRRSGVLVGMLVLVAACGTDPIGSESAASTPRSEISTSPQILESTTDGSTVLPPRFVEPSPDTDFPRRQVEPGATWRPPDLRTESVNLSVVAFGDEAAAALPNPPARGFRFELSSCVTAAPFVWVIEGSISADDPLPDSVVLSLHHVSGDVVVIRQVHVTITGEGAFRFLLDGRAGERPTVYFGRHECRIHVEGYGPKAVAIVEPVDPPGGVVWEAPAGSVHKLGMGALIGDPSSPGLGWTYLNWAEPSLPFETVLAAVPESGVVQVTGVQGLIDPSRACRAVVSDLFVFETSREATLVQWRDCPQRDRIGPFDRGPIDAYPNASVSDYGAGTWITVHGSVADTSFKVTAQDLITALAALDHLELRTNLAVPERADSPFRADDLDEAIASRSQQRAPPRSPGPSSSGDGSSWPIPSTSSSSDRTETSRWRCR